jgi:hypothetical protein
MTYFTRLSVTLGLLAAPLVGFAHPGHFDFAPIAHDMAHAMPYVLMAIAGVLVAQRVFRVLRAKSRRDR